MMEIDKDIYKYSREIMWLEEEKVFIAITIELSGCKAVGRTAAKALENLDIAIDEWIKIAKEKGQVIPKPLCYEEINGNELEEKSDKEYPYYDSISKTWKLITDCGREEGDALYIASEYVKGGLIYPFHSEVGNNEKYHNHMHNFIDVVALILNKVEYFSIKGFEEYYSQQEKKLLDDLLLKLNVSK